MLTKKEPSESVKPVIAVSLNRTVNTLLISALYDYNNEESHTYQSTWHVLKALKSLKKALLRHRVRHAFCTFQKIYDTVGELNSKR